MGKVNVVLPGGKVVSVDEATAAQIEGSKLVHRQSVEAEDANRMQREHDAQYAGVGSTVKAALVGAADNLTFGGATTAAGVIGGEDFRNDLVESAKAHPIAYDVGAIGSMLVPVGATSLAAGAGRAVEGAIAQEGVSALGKAAGRVAEGAILGADGHLASTNVTGDPVTIEGMALSMGVGSVLNVGMGAVGDKVKTWGSKAKTVVEEAEAVRGDVSLYKEGSEVFSKPRESWDGFHDALKSVDEDASKAVQAEEKAAKDYEKYVSGPASQKNINNALKQAEKVRNDLQDKISQSKYGKAIEETGEAFDEAGEQLGKLKDKANKLTSSTEDWPSVVKGVDDAINEVRGRYAPAGSEETLFKPKLEGWTGSFDERQFFEKGEAFYSARTKKPPISEKLDKELKEYSARASRIRQMRQGGTKQEAGQWIADPAAPPNPEGALKELHKLRADFSKRFGGVEFPDLPAVPEIAAPLASRGGEVTPLNGTPQMDEIRKLSKTSRELSDTIAQARQKFAAGDKVGAAEDLRMLQGQAAANGMNDLVLPVIPAKAAPPIKGPPMRIPKTLTELAAMKPETVERLANLMQKDPQGRIATEFNKLAGELGTDPADGLAGLHAKLGKYMGAHDRLKAIALKAAEEEGGDGMLALLRRGAKKFVRYGAARAADSALGGKWLGAAGRVFAGEGTGAVMNATEDLISGSMMQSKLGLKSAVAKIIAKVGEPVGNAAHTLAPITSYLQSGLLTGQPDKDHKDDYTAATVNRINEALSIGTTANDSAFIAVQSLLGHASDVGYKMVAKTVGDIQHIIETAPKDPGISQHMLKSDWQPQPDEAYEWGYRIEAVMNPLAAIERTISGDGHPAAVDSLWIRWPALMQSLAGEMAFAMHDAENVSYETATNLSLLFRTPMTGLMDPSVMMELQGMYLPQPEQQPQSGGGGGGSGNPVGRPAAIQNSVAGSSVSGLLQTA